MPAHTHCRICESPLPKPFLDLGSMPLANAFLTAEQEFNEEPKYPLAVVACPHCGLVQLDFVVPAEQLYRRYLYVSSTSEAVRRYADELAARVVAAYALGPSDRVIEFGSNDGLILHAFHRQGVQVLGVEPARNIAALARQNGIPTVEEFFCETTASSLAAEHGRASVLLGRHVFAHIDDWHDFFRGASKLLSSNGVLLIEVPYLGTLITQLEFDTIYHEHLSYIALGPIQQLCALHDFEPVDVETVSLHGGSVLIAMQRKGQGKRSARLAAMLQEEARLGLTTPEALNAFARRVTEWKETFETYLERLRCSGASLVGYGAAAKANTLLNYCPVAARSLQYVLDRSPLKRGLYTPGTHLRVVDAATWEPDGVTHLVILAWNFKDEIMKQMQPFAGRGGRFVVPIPEPEVV